MKSSTKENELVLLNKNSILYKLKMFFRKFMNKQSGFTERESDLNYNKKDNTKEKFLQYVKENVDEDTEILELQNKYKNENIREEDLSERQKYLLCKLYDKQIMNLRKSNELRMKKLASNNN